MVPLIQDFSVFLIFLCSIFKTTFIVFAKFTGPWDILPQPFSMCCLVSMNIAKDTRGFCEIQSGNAEFYWK